MRAATAGTDPVKVIAQNRKARHDYEVLASLEAGLALRGTEVKSVRAGKVNLKDSYARLEGGEVHLLHLHISPYEAASHFNHDPERPRKLLLHRYEIRRLAGQLEQRGFTLVPLRIYLRRGVAKVELGLVRGKRQFDKRDDIGRRDAQRAIERAFADQQ